MGAKSCAHVPLRMHTRGLARDVLHLLPPHHELLLPLLDVVLHRLVLMHLLVELLEEAGERGHYSRGERCAAEAGVLPGENKNCLPHAAMRGWAERVPRGGVRA